MKKLTLFLAFFVLATRTIAQVGIGTTTPDSSAILDIQSDSLGILIPRITSESRTTISNPANGLMVYDISTESFWGFANGEWKEFLSESNPNPYFEVGTTFSRAFNESVFANIHYFDQPFDTTPIVVSTIEASIFNQGAYWSRLEKPPSSNRFDFRTNAYVDQLNFFAIPPGEYSISGKKLVAGRAEDLSSGTNTIDLPDVFNEFPIVIVSLELPTSIGGAATGLRIQDVDSSEFEVWTNSSANIQWIAMDPGEYEFNGWKWYADFSNLSPGADHTVAYPTNFDTKNQSPIVLVSLADSNGSGPTVGRLIDVTNTNFTFNVNGSGLEILHWVVFVKE